MSRVAPVIVGALLVLESLAMLCVAAFACIVGGLAGALAFGVGGGSATNAQLAQGMAVMALNVNGVFLGNGTGASVDDDSSIESSLFIGNDRAVFVTSSGNVGTVATIKGSTFSQNAVGVITSSPVDFLLNTFYRSPVQLDLDASPRFFFDSFPGSAGDIGSALVFTGGYLSLRVENSAFWPAPPYAPYDPQLPPMTLSIADSCFTGATGNNNQALTQDPFVVRDTDADGVDEYYLDPTSPCADHGSSASADTGSVAWQNPDHEHLRHPRRDPARYGEPLRPEEHWGL